MKAVVKDHKVQVSLNEQDAADLARLVRLETKLQREKQFEARLLREFAMPLVRARLVELAAAEQVAA